MGTRIPSGPLCTLSTIARPRPSEGSLSRNAKHSVISIAECFFVYCAGLADASRTRLAQASYYPFGDPRAVPEVVAAIIWQCRVKVDQSAIWTLHNAPLYSPDNAASQRLALALKCRNFATRLQWRGRSQIARRSLTLASALAHSFPLRVEPHPARVRHARASSSSPPMISAAGHR